MPDFVERLSWTDCGAIIINNFKHEALRGFLLATAFNENLYIGNAQSTYLEAQGDFGWTTVHGRQQKRVEASVDELESLVSRCTSDDLW